MDWFASKTRNSDCARLIWSWWSCPQADMSERQFDILSETEGSSGETTDTADTASQCQWMIGYSGFVYMAQSTSTAPCGTPVESW